MSHLFPFFTPGALALLSQVSGFDTLYNTFFSPAPLPFPPPRGINQQLSPAFIMRLISPLCSAPIRVFFSRQASFFSPTCSPLVFDATLVHLIVLLSGLVTPDTFPPAEVFSAIATAESNIKKLTYCSPQGLCFGSLFSVTADQFCSNSVDQSSPPPISEQIVFFHAPLRKLLFPLTWFPSLTPFWYSLTL